MTRYTPFVAAGVFWALPFLFGAAVGQVPLPGTSSVSVPLAPPFSCESCHGGFEAGSAFDTWAGSPMGHAARDPLFLSALTEAEKDSPGIGDFCLRCHAPEAWLQGRCVPTDGSTLLAEDSGVTCSVCHRMQPSVWRRNGQYAIAEDLEYRGPYDDAVAPHRNRASTWISDAALCGSCHDLFNPRVERRAPDGSPMGMRFPEQTTYSEWAASAYARSPGGSTCQDCHMPETAGRVAEEAGVRPDRSSHELAGGNVFLLRAIAFLEPGLGLSAQLVEGEARQRAILRRAAELDAVDPPITVARGAPLALTFRVTNLAGHKLPTGYPEGRRVWLSVTSELLGLSLGAFDRASGEPLRPAALYEVRQGQRALGPGPRLALNDTVFFDSRIPPMGMVSTATTAPVGKTYLELPSGVLAHFDEVTVTATVPCDLSRPVISVSAALWYQAVTARSVASLVASNGDDPRGARLGAAFLEADPGPIEMAAASVEIAVEDGGACGTDAGASDRGRGDGEGADAAGVLADGGGAGEGGSDGVRGDADGGCGCRMSDRGSDDGGAWGRLLALIFVGGSWGALRKLCRRGRA